LIGACAHTKALCLHKALLACDTGPSIQLQLHAMLRQFKCTVESAGGLLLYGTKIMHRATKNGQTSEQKCSCGQSLILHATVASNLPMAAII